MEYLLLIYEDERKRDSWSDADRQAIMAGYMAFSQSLVDAGVMRGGNALREVAETQTLRVRDGENVVTDGPFAETKEQLGGYYLIDCASMAEALDWAAKIPTAKTGTIEVRPIMVFE